MAISDRLMDQAFSDLKSTCGGVRNDYFGVLYLEQEFKLDREHAVLQVAFGGGDYGIDAFYFDQEKRNLYLFQFKYTESYKQFESSFRRLTDAGMERLFAAQRQDQNQNQMLLQLKSCIAENEALIDRVCIHFVFVGDPEEAERSQVLDKLREDLENKKYLIDQRFGREVILLIEFRSARTKKVGAAVHVRKTHQYPVQLGETIASDCCGHQRMTIGFVGVEDLCRMYREMGGRFFERNIRSALSADKAVNRSIQQSIKRIVIDGSVRPETFTFDHNGVTLFAESLDKGQNGEWSITEPRLLNGAQTVTTVARFVNAHEGNPALDAGRDSLAKIRVLCRVITNATPDFVTTVTINNNRQNPVDPWNLHANDMIQLQIQDKFREDAGIYYERQEKAFEHLSDEHLEESGITQQKAVELTKLARTFLASDGDIDKFSRFTEIFEDDRMYNAVFSEARLNADTRHVLLCYKAQFRLRKCANAIEQLGALKYGFISGARNLLWALLCQAILNDADIQEKAELYGSALTVEAQYTEWLSGLATKRCRLVLSDLIADPDYAENVIEGAWGFLRSRTAFERSMEVAHRRWKWVKKRLR